MPVINIAIGRSKYQVDCEIGEEEKIKRLANALNQRVNSLMLNIRGADEKTILMLCALMIEEELESCKIELAEIDQEINPSRGKISSPSIINSEPNPSFTNQDLERLEEVTIKTFESLSHTIENLANKIKNS